MPEIFAVLVMAAAAAAKTDDWKFLGQYPPHYVTRKLAANEAIKVDGRLDDAAWSSADSTYDMVDITQHPDQQYNAVPNDVQARVKIRWDDNFLYVGAELNEPFVSGKLFGHNNVRCGICVVACGRV